MYACLSSIALRPSASTCSSLFNYCKEKVPTSAQNEEDANETARSKSTMHGQSTTQRARRTEGLLSSMHTETEMGQRTWHFLRRSCSGEEKGRKTTRVQIKEGRYSLAVRNPVSSEHDPQM